MQVILHDGTNWLSVQVTGSYYQMDTWEDLENSGIYQYLEDEIDYEIPHAYGFDGSMVFADIYRESFAIISTFDVDEDADCSLTGDAIDEQLIRILATIGPYVDDT